MPTTQEQEDLRNAADSFERAVGAKVRDLRLGRGWSQSDLAERMAHLGFPMHQATIAKLEAAQRPIRASEMYALAMAFGLTPAAWWYLPVPGEPEALAADRKRLQGLDDRLAGLEANLDEILRGYAEIRAERQRIAMEMDAAAREVGEVPDGAR